MRILSIETSCDDTGIAVLRARGQGLGSSFETLANVVSSQQIHQNYGGVFPMMAKREHQANLVPVLTRALKEAKLANPKSEFLNPKQIKILKEIFKREEKLFEYTVKFLQTYEKPEIDAIAVTYGPGLEPCLWVGVNFARALSYFWDIPLIPVNHIEAHILVNFLDPRPSTLAPKKIFPAISLVVSGGHTQLILVKKLGKYEIIGETRDDAAGECFDKCAKLLGLGYPGGPIISKIASDYNLDPRPYILKLPRPMINSKDYDFSFSGLKTAVLYEAKGKELTKEYVGAMCVELQQAIIDVLLKKTLQAAKDFKAKTVILGGGVSANQELRKRLTKKINKEIPGVQCLKPDVKHSTDNGLMIAVAAYLNRKKTVAWKNLEANANLRIGQ